MNLDNYSSIFQTREWSEFKANFGWKAHKIGKVWILQKNLAFRKSVLYIPEISKKNLLDLYNAKH